MCLSANKAISVPCACLKPNWLSANHRYPWRVATARPAQVPWRELWQLQLQLVLTSSGPFDLHFSCGMITSCIRVLCYLPVRMQPEWNIDIMVSSQSDENFLTSDLIPSLPTAFIFFSPLTICLSLITSLWPVTVPNAFIT